MHELKAGLNADKFAIFFTLIDLNALKLFPVVCCYGRQEWTWAFLRVLFQCKIAKNIIWLVLRL